MTRLDHDSTVQMLLTKRRNKPRVGRKPELKLDLWDANTTGCLRVLSPDEIEVVWEVWEGILLPCLLARIMQEIRIRVDWGPEKMP